MTKIIAVTKIMIAITIMIIVRHIMVISQHITVTGNWHDNDNNLTQGGGLGPVRIRKCEDHRKHKVFTGHQITPYTFSVSIFYFLKFYGPQINPPQMWHLLRANTGGQPMG